MLLRDNWRHLIMQSYALYELCSFPWKSSFSPWFLQKTSARVIKTIGSKSFEEFEKFSQGTCGLFFCSFQWLVGGRTGDPLGTHFRRIGDNWGLIGDPLRAHWTYWGCFPDLSCKSLPFFQVATLFGTHWGRIFPLTLTETSARVIETIGSKSFEEFKKFSQGTCWLFFCSFQWLVWP